MTQNNNYYTREIAPPEGKIRLQVELRDAAGVLRNADPRTLSLTIFDAANDTVFTTTRLIQAGTGKYYYVYKIPRVSDGYDFGVWTDFWSCQLDNTEVTYSSDFTVSNEGTMTASGSSVLQQKLKIGDSPFAEYNQYEIFGINSLMSLLKTRLESRGIDVNGEKCDVFTDKKLLDYLKLSLSEFNQTPTVTFFKFSDNLIYTLWADIITEGASLTALAAQSIIEAGREFQIQDNGTSITPPQLSNALKSLHDTLLSDYRTKLRSIKQNIKPAPLGLGAGSLVSTSPYFRRLRFLREKRII